MKILFTTVCNDRYTHALVLLLWSIRRHNPGFDHPFKVYYKGELGSKSQARIASVYPNIHFENVQKPEYQQKISHYLALETFCETEPDSVVFIDSDIICLGDISELCQLDYPISAALDYDFRFERHLNVKPPISRLARLNTGVFALNRHYRDGKTYDALYSLLDQFPAKREKGMLWSDQGVMNLYFRNAKKHILPLRLNARKNLFANRKFSQGREKALGDVRLLHFGGTCKPFLGGLKNAPPDSKHQKYSMLHDVYYDYWKDMQADLGVDWPLCEPPEASI
jgi:lipopolysaccharide biosynthesis glycosyltransferase